MVDKNKAVLATLQEEERQDDDRHITLSTGVKLKVKAVSPYVFNRVKSKFKAPKPPMIYLENYDREEPNYNDPAYLAEVEAVSEAAGEAISDVMISLGTEIVSIPVEMPDIKESEWLDALLMTFVVDDEEIEIANKNANYRKLLWLKFVGISTSEDIQNLTTKILMLSNVTDAEVAQEVDNFRGDEERTADL